MPKSPDPAILSFTMRTDRNATVRLSDYCRSGLARELREDAGLSLAGLAAMVEVAPSTISRWERGIRGPRGRVGAKYLRVLDGLARREAP